MVGFISGPASDPLALQDTPFDSTTSEVWGSEAASVLHAVPTSGATRRFTQGTTALAAAQGQFQADPRNAGSDVDAMEAERGPGPDTTPLSTQDATERAKNAGVQDLTFTAPTSIGTADAIIDDHLQAQQRQGMIDRRASGILTGGVARFGIDLLVGLADPLNIAAAFIPVAPEAFVAEKMAAASGVFERGLITAAHGAAQGAAGQAALEPLNYAISRGDYNDWTAGQSLYNIALGAAMGGVLHVGLSALSGRLAAAPPEVREGAFRAATAQVLDDKPVDVTGVLDAGTATAAADELHQVARPAFEGGITAYHGTPGDFDAFDTRHIGTGEGNQAYGYGLYFGENSAVADFYRKQTSGPATAFDGKLSPDLEAVLRAEDNLGFETPAEAVRAMRSHPDWATRWDVQDPQALSAAFDTHEAAKYGGQGHVYAAQIRATSAEMIDADKPLSEQSPLVQRALATIQRRDFQPGDAGLDLVPKTAEMAAAYRAAGIKGVQYRDAGSRDGAEAGTRNYVMFDHNDVQITHRDGVPVPEAVAQDRAEATGAAQDMAKRATNPPKDPDEVQVAANAKAVAEAPAASGAPDQQLAEVTKDYQDRVAQHQAAQAAGALPEHDAATLAALAEADHADATAKGILGCAALWGGH